jgi:hypothetical protein
MPEPAVSHVVEKLNDPSIGREASKDLGVLTRCGVAEKHVAGTGNLDIACWRPVF